MVPRKGFKLDKSSKEVHWKLQTKHKHTRSLKNKLRDVQRLLKKSDLPATVRVVQERMLDVLKENIRQKAKHEKEKKNLKHYKKVKFFEKRKLIRRYKACLKELHSCKEQSDEREGLEKELKEIKVHWNYVVHFPSDMRYISLFPVMSCTNVKVLERQEQIMKMVKEKVACGELEDTSEAMEQFLSGSKEKGKGTLNPKPKKSLSLKEIEGQKTRDNEGPTEKEDSEEEGQSMCGVEDDFFIDSTSGTGYIS